MAGILYILGTPIGNLDDITKRAIDTLLGVDIVLAEDTRVSSKLLNHLNIKKKLISYQHHSTDAKKLEILSLLTSGNSLALITDAGTPGISDPGNELIDFLLANDPSIKVVPIPGVSATTSALSVCGFNASHFSFIGFLPKKKLNKTLKQVAESETLVVYFDSPYRVLKNLKRLSEFVDAGRRVFVGHELTKMHESLFRGPIAEVIASLEQQKTLKGEFVVVIES